MLSNIAPATQMLARQFLSVQDFADLLKVGEGPADTDAHHAANIGPGKKG